MSSMPFLTDEEIAGICDPLVMPAAQRRYLSTNLGLMVKEKPGGKPLVARSEFERVLGAQRLALDDGSQIGPNVAAVRERWANRKSHGTQA